MKLKIIISALLIFQSLLYSKIILEPDAYTKEGYCIVTSKYQKHLGLTRFDTKHQFKEHCKGKMIFKYNENKCRWFTMKGMKFNVYISNGKNKQLFKIGKRKKICSKKVIESI